MTRRTRYAVALAAALASAGSGPLSADPQMVGGNPAELHEYPFMAQLRLRNAIGWQNAHFCGGTLIAPRWVVTAAHCLLTTNASGQIVNRLAADIEVVLGEHFLPFPEGTEVVRDVQEIRRHPQFSQTSRLNDIALLYLSSAVPLTPGVIETGTIVADPPLPGTLVSATGWGIVARPSQLPGGPLNPFLSDQLLEADLSSMWMGECQAFLAGQGLPMGQQVCAQGPPGVSSCRGDSGGPLMSWNGTSWSPYGVTSFGADCEGPAVYTKLYSFQPWIQAWQVIRDSGVNPTITCFPQSGMTGCSVTGPWSAAYGYNITWSSPNTSLRTIYPLYSLAFPFSVVSNTIYFSLGGNHPFTPCPSGTPISASFSFDGITVGQASTTCP